MTTRYSEFAGRVVVVTGGSKALGAATARAFAENGGKVVVSGRDRGAIDRVVSSIVADGLTAIGVVADVTSRDQLTALRETTERELGAAEILMAFAGGNGEPAPSVTLADERWRVATDVNLTATFLTLQTFLPAMIERRRGSVVTMASAAARQPAKSNVAYAAAKAGVVAMTRHIASEIGPSGVRLNCLAPSAVLNERMQANMSPEAIAALGESFPLRRVGEPRDVADAALWLASEGAGWITGQVIDVAGGKIMV